MGKLRQRLYIILEREPKREDKLSRFVNIFLFYLIWLNLTVIVIGIIVDLPVIVERIFRYIEIFSIVIFSVEYLLRIIVDPCKPPALVSKNVILSKLPPYLRYIFSPLGLIDLIAVLPFYLPLVFPVDLRVLRVLRMVRLMRVLKLGRYDKSLKMLSKVLDNALQGLANVIEYRDKDSGEHVKRTQLYVKVLIDHLIDTESVYAAELRKLEPEIIVKSMALHDVGKIAIPDRVLLKPGKLDPDEFEIMKTHTTRGRDIINELGDVKSAIYLKYCEDITYCHHERWDGKGYPRKLKGEEIPLIARLAALADVYDALVCARAYKPAMPYEDAIRIITEGRGTQFDPVVVDAFLEIQEQFKEITRKYQ